MTYHIRSFIYIYIIFLCARASLGRNQNWKPIEQKTECAYRMRASAPCVTETISWPLSSNVMWSHLMSCQPFSPHLILSHLTSSDPISSHLIWRPLNLLSVHLISSDLISSHPISCFSPLLGSSQLFSADRSCFISSFHLFSNLLNCGHLFSSHLSFSDLLSAHLNSSFSSSHLISSLVISSGRHSSSNLIPCLYDVLRFPLKCCWSFFTVQGFCVLRSPQRQARVLHGPQRHTQWLIYRLPFLHSCLENRATCFPNQNACGTQVDTLLLWFVRVIHRTWQTPPIVFTRFVGGKTSNFWHPAKLNLNLLW